MINIHQPERCMNDAAPHQNHDAAAHQNDAPQKKKKPFGSLISDAKFKFVFCSLGFAHYIAQVKSNMTKSNIHILYFCHK